MTHCSETAHTPEVHSHRMQTQITPWLYLLALQDTIKIVLISGTSVDIRNQMCLFSRLLWQWKCEQLDSELKKRVALPLGGLMLLACYFETASHCVAQAGLKLIILLLQPLERRRVPPQTAVDMVSKPGFLSDVGRIHSLSMAIP